MSVEAVMLCLDTSEWCRNADYVPDRIQAETEAANLICGAKSQQHPETAVGVLTMNGSSDGSSVNVRGIQIAQLVLKHRQNKNQKQRIVCFVGSPVSATKKQMETLGKNLKKNNVAIDIISFGEVDANKPMLQDLLEHAQSSGNSCMVEIPPHTDQIMSDVLMGTPIVTPEGAAPPAAAGDGGFEFGVDPSQDPELAMALRMSMEEERARQGQSTAADASAQQGGSRRSVARPAGTGVESSVATPQMDPRLQAALADAAAAGEEVDDELRQALLLSLQESDTQQNSQQKTEEEGKDKEKTPAAEESTTAKPSAPSAPAPAGDDMDEELRKALMESLEDWDGGEKAGGDGEAPAEKKQKQEQPSSSSSSSSAAQGPSDDAAIFQVGFEIPSFLIGAFPQDPSMVAELLSGLPGVDLNDPRIQEALKDLQEDKKEPSDKDDDEKKK
ncbi:26s proteasome non-ATPase regulatory subunit, putative [Perkinsus marinus ATCC 50983]|uniref:26s proteasome non-ATPase regulatory subunit, putative n=1 Tax=Perkinsus marinus (strain ATCC 50983 / TXsc) TaxID=423536 RepID=C5LD32_PERM5|nr:26s proteasome non-ATPase regulatory subunit, putative [Perkinsus marinus ATCC 50983]EER05376.1 26s proteasome non-ATPase regulatory subunit, putative [Perkinsus marinus ATCC 50983]|eukprot:XP_002773560.1 26s proteasome non-ATPase regulatory subunit, putative [Perkinsus marinus ATCC 50983]